MRQCLAEGCGSFVLVTLGCGAIAVDQVYAGCLGSLGIALSFGLTTLALVGALGQASGAHLNPAVTLAFFLRGRLSGQQAWRYLLGQFLGAILAAVLLRLLFLDVERLHLGFVQPADSPLRAFAAETLATAIMVFLLLHAATGHRLSGPQAGLTAAAVLTAAILVTTPISGGALNPARALAPALDLVTLRGQWLYLLAPLLGAVLAQGCHRLTAPGGVADSP